MAVFLTLLFCMTWRFGESLVDHISPHDPHSELVNCWNDAPDSLRENCCNSPSDPLHCFDSIFTKVECCSRGLALVVPPHVPVVPLPDENVDTVRDQAMWEHLVLNATELTHTKLGGADVVVRYFKRWAGQIPWFFEDVVEYGFDKLYLPAQGSGFWAVDLGANIGVMTLELLKRNPLLRVLSVEPSPSLFRYLVWNLRANGVAHRTVALNMAIGAIDGSMTLQEYITMPSRASLREKSSTSNGDSEDLGSLVDVPVRTLLQALELARIRLDDVSVLKVDCEGCEWNLLSVPSLWSSVNSGRIMLASELHLPEGRSEEELEWQRLVQMFCADSPQLSDWEKHDHFKLRMVCVRPHLKT
eukprot:TRINITY_DN61950_c0_g1_i1.p1 TRINITY_DN61950_c0_g1~~TRINITY_DN61950_c0_g1_i1.p1  ORF type:complete len:358 (+),score=38.18 TRINITY_DN61950_c0_g1_i1:59-1132(+)